MSRNHIEKWGKKYMYKLRLVMARVQYEVSCSAGTKIFEQYLARLPCPVKCQKCQFTYWRRVVGKLILGIRETWHQSAFKAIEDTKLSLEFIGGGIKNLGWRRLSFLELRHVFNLQPVSVLDLKNFVKLNKSRDCF